MATVRPKIRLVAELSCAHEHDARTSSYQSVSPRVRACPLLWRVRPTIMMAQQSCTIGALVLDGLQHRPWRRLGSLRLCDKLLWLPAPAAEPRASPAVAAEAWLPPGSPVPPTAPPIAPPTAPPDAVAAPPCAMRSGLARSSVYTVRSCSAAPARPRSHRHGVLRQGERNVIECVCSGPSRLPGGRCELRAGRGCNSADHARQLR